MTKLLWDQVGQRVFETGVDHGVLYLHDDAGVYDSGFAWNGLTTITESPSGADASPQYADNIKYLNLVAAEEFGGTIEAFTYPDEFAECDGTAVVSGGVAISQQTRRTFGLSYRTKVGNDVDADAGYKLHLVYGALAAPSEKARATVNDSPEALALSWDFSTTPVQVPGNNPTTGKPFKPTATLTVDSRNVDAAALATLEDRLYGTAGADPSLPLPGEVIALFAGTVTEVRPVAPTQAGNVLTIPTTAGVVYEVDGTPVTGDYNMTDDTVVTARPAAGYSFPAVSDDDWYYAHS